MWKRHHAYHTTILQLQSFLCIFCHESLVQTLLVVDSISIRNLHLNKSWWRIMLLSLHVYHIEDGDVTAVPFGAFAATTTDIR